MCPRMERKVISQWKEITDKRVGQRYKGSQYASGAENH